MSIGNGKGIISALCAACMLVILAACGSGSAEDDVVTLEIGTSMTEEDFRSEYIRQFAETVEERTDGRVVTNIHYQDEYSDHPILMEDIMTKGGRLDVVLVAAPYLAEQTIPEEAVSGLPYIFYDFEDAWQFMDSDINADIESRLPEYGVRVLGDYCGGFRCFSNSVRRIEEPSDMEGLIMGTVKSKIMLDMFEALGCHPQPALFSEMKGSLEKGIYDGTDWGVQTFYRDAIYELQPYITVSNHSYNLWCLTIREDTWQRLSEADREIILAAGRESALAEREASKASTDDIFASFEEMGLDVTYPDTAAFMEATQSVRENYSADYSDIYAEVLRELGR